MKLINLIKYRGLRCVIKKIILFPIHFFKNLIIKKKSNLLKTEVETKDLPLFKDIVNNIKNGYIVSLTSYVQRFPELYLTLKSILLQTILPEKIIVYFGSDVKKDDLTGDLLSLLDYNVEYRFDNKMNLMPHKKYFYSLREFPDKSVITIDDDIIFPCTAIEELVNCSILHPECICARRVHKITFRKNKINPYIYWELDYKNANMPSNDLLATTGAGVLYPPNSIDERAFDLNVIKKYCLKTDDIWMKCIEILNNRKVVYCKNNLMGAFIKENDSNGLMILNVGNNQNDICLNNLINEYNISIESFY